MENRKEIEKLVVPKLKTRPFFPISKSMCNSVRSPGLLPPSSSSSSSSLSFLPVEIWMRIFMSKTLDISDIKSISRCSKLFNAIINENYLWCVLCYREKFKLVDTIREEIGSRYSESHVIEKRIRMLFRSVLGDPVWAARLVRLFKSLDGSQDNWDELLHSFPSKIVNWKGVYLLRERQIAFSKAYEHCKKGNESFNLTTGIQIQSCVYCSRVLNDRPNSLVMEIPVSISDSAFSSTASSLSSSPITVNYDWTRCKGRGDPRSSISEAVVPQIFNLWKDNQDFIHKRRQVNACLHCKLMRSDY